MRTLSTKIFSYVIKQNMQKHTCREKNTNQLITSNSSAHFFIPINFGTNFY